MPFFSFEKKLENELSASPFKANSKRKGRGGRKLNFFYVTGSDQDKAVQKDQHKKTEMLSKKKKKRNSNLKQK